MNKCIQCREVIYGSFFSKDYLIYCWKCTADARIRELKRRYDLGDWIDLVDLIEETLGDNQVHP